MESASNPAKLEIGEIKAFGRSVRAKSALIQGEFDV
jgi:hypothetical protein